MPRGYATFQDVVVAAATDKALLVDFGDGEQLWVPRSQIGDDSDVHDKGDEGDIDITEWWCRENGLD